MKKFMKKSVSWVLTVAMVCPMIAQTLAFLPISFAEETNGPRFNDDGTWKDWDGWVLTADGNSFVKNGQVDNVLDYDEIEAAVAYYKAHNNTGTNENTDELTGVIYNTATMYNYDHWKFNYAMHEAEVQWYAGLASDYNWNVNPPLENGKWNSLYFYEDWTDGIFINTIGADISSTSYDDVDLEDGTYYLYNFRSGSFVAAKNDSDKQVENSRFGDYALGPTKDESKAIALTFKKQDGGTYTITDSTGQQYLTLISETCYDCELGINKETGLHEAHGRDTSYFLSTPDEKYSYFYLYRFGKDGIAIATRGISAKSESNPNVLNDIGDGFGCFGAYATTPLGDPGNKFVLYKENSSKMKVQLPEPSDDSTINIAEGTYYLYNSESGKFVADIEDSNEEIKQDRFENCKLAYAPSENEAIALTFTPQGNGTYTITNSNKYLTLIHDNTYETSCFLDEADSDYSYFYLYKFGDDGIAIATKGNSNKTGSESKQNYLNNSGWSGIFGAYASDLNNAGNKFILYNQPKLIEVQLPEAVCGLNGQYVLENTSENLWVEYKSEETEGTEETEETGKLLWSNLGATVWTVEETSENSGVYTLRNSAGYFLKSDFSSTTAKIDQRGYFKFYKNGDKNVILCGIASDKMYFLNNVDENNGNVLNGDVKNTAVAIVNNAADYSFRLRKITMNNADQIPYMPFSYADLNNYTGNIGSNTAKGSAAVNGIVENTLDENYNIRFKAADAGIFGDTEVNGKKIYNNVGIPFVPITNMAGTGGEQKPYTTYVFDSDLFGAYFANGADNNTNLTATVGSQHGTAGYPHSWWPFNNTQGETPYDYHFGMTMSIPFTMTNNGLIGGTDDITFTFRGDDDVWIFIDGKLVLDLGGIHDRLGGTLNFADNKWTLDYPTSADLSEADLAAGKGKVAYTDGSATGGKLFNDVNGNDGVLGKTLATFADEGIHELTIFYLERGAGASNCRITYNMPMPDYITVSKTVSVDGRAITTEEQQAVSEQEFEFELHRIWGYPYPAITGAYDLLDRNGHLIEHDVQTDVDGTFTLKDGQSARFELDNSEMDVTTGATFYVIEKPVVGFAASKWSYAASAANGVQLIDPKDQSRTLSIDDVIPSYSNPNFYQTSDSYWVKVYGSELTPDTIDFKCDNTWSLSDTIVLDYGLGVDIDISQLHGWEYSGYTLSDIVIQNYHDTDGNGTPDAQAQYGTVDNLTFELENNGSNGVEWHGENQIGLENDNKGVIHGVGNTEKDYVTVTFNSDKACTATIAIYYASANGSPRYMWVTVSDENGNKTYSGSEPVEFATNGSWSFAGNKPAYVEVQLKEGENVIKLEGCDQNGTYVQGTSYAPNLDKIVVDLTPNDAKFTYQLTEQMTAVDVLKYTVTATQEFANETVTGRIPGIIYIVPATVMYYEENFKEAGTDNSNGNWINYVNNNENFTDWNPVGTEDTTNKQEAGIPGQADYIYGRDDAYLNDAGDSNGTSMHVNTLTDNTPAQFSYTFTGTGTTFFGRMGDNTGFMQVVITDSNGAEVYRYYRDTQYVDTNGSNTDEGVADGKLGVPIGYQSNDSTKYFYGIPLFTWDTSDSNLDYGTYTVTVTIAKPLAVNDIGDDALDRYVYGTEFWLDGIRVVNPLDMSPLTRAVEVMAVDEPVALAEEVTPRAIDNTAVFEAERVNVALGAYEADHETNPAITTVRDKILSDYEGATGSWKLQSGLTGSPVMPKAFTDIMSPLPGATEFKYYGPKEEVYLDSADKQSVTIYLPVGSLDLSKNQVHLGFKAPLANSGLEITVGNETDPTSYTVNNSTDCYYNITTLLTNDNKTGNYYKITIEATDGLVSLTNIKVTETNGYDFVA